MSTTTPDENSPTMLAWRLRALEEAEREHRPKAEAAMKNLAAIDTTVNGERGLVKGYEVLAEEIRSLRRTIMGVGASVVVAAVVLTVLQRVLPG